MDGGEALDCCEPHGRQYLIDHRLPIDQGKTLDQRHIVQIIVKERSADVSQRLGHSRTALFFELLQHGLQLFFAASGLVRFDQLLDMDLIAAVELLIALLLIIARDLQPQMTAAGMNDQVQRAVLILIHLDKMVAAAQGADGAAGSAQIDSFGTAQRREVDGFIVWMQRLTNGKTRWYPLTDDLIQRFQIQRLLCQPHGLHTTADVHTHQIGHHFIGDGHGRSDGAALAGVHIGHDADLAASRKSLVAQ